MSRGFPRATILLVLVATVTATLFALIGTLDESGIVGLTCGPCGWPGITAWGYFEDLLGVVLLCSPALFFVAFYSMGLSRWRAGALVLSEVIAFGYALLLGAANLSTTKPTPDLSVFAVLMPVGLVTAVGYLLVSTQEAVTSP